MGGLESSNFAKKEIFSFLKDFFFTQTHFFKQLEFSLQTFTLRGAEMLLMPMEAKKKEPLFPFNQKIWRKLFRPFVFLREMNLQKRDLKQS